MEPDELDLKQIIKDNYMKTGEFTLSSGHVATRYFDIKGLMGHSVHSSLLLFELGTLLDNKFNYDSNIGSIGGIELGGVIIAASLPYSRNTCFIRKRNIGHGLGKTIEGLPKSPILLIDDVITTSNTVANAVQICIDGGFIVAGVVCVIDRRFMSDENDRKLLVLCGMNGTPSGVVRVPFYSLFKESDFD